MSQTDHIDATPPGPGDAAFIGPDIPVREAGGSRLSRWGDRTADWGLALLGEATAIVLGVALAWCGALVWLVERGGADVTALVPNAEMWFAEAYDGRAATIGTLRLDVDARGDRLRLAGRGIDVTGADGATLQTLEDLSVDIALSEAVRGRVDLTALTATGGAVSVVRDEDGWKAGLGRPETLGNLGPIAEIGAEIGAETGRGGVEGSVGGNAEIPPIELTDVDVHVRDEVDGLDLVLDSAIVRIAGGRKLSGALSGELVTLSGEAPGSQGRVQANLSPAEPDADRVADRLNVTFTSLKPSALAAERGPLASLSAVDLPLAGTVSVLREGGAWTELTASAEVGSGNLNLGERGLQVEEGAFNMSVDLRTGAHELRDASLVSDLVELSGGWRGNWADGRLRGAVALDRAVVDAAELGVEGLEPVTIGRSATVLSWDGDVLGLADLDLGLAGARFKGLSRLSLNEGRLSAATAELAMEGELSAETLLSLWPEEMVGGARRWIARSVLGGRITDLSVSADLDGDALAARPLPNEAVRVDFTVEEGTVRYISTMTPMTNAQGRGVLLGNRFDFALERGRIDGLDVATATIAMPRLVPKGGPMTIRARGSGSAPEMLSLIDQEPFGFATRYNIVPAEFAGTGAIDLTITRPIREFITPDQVSYEVSGDFTGVRVPLELAGETLSNGELRIEADATRLSLAGPVSFGPWRAELTYLDPLGDDGMAPTVATLAGTLSRDSLDGFGLGFRQFFDGNIPVEIEATSDGLALREARIAADLTGVALSLDPYWAKPYGIAGELTTTLRRSDGRSTFEDVRITAPDMSLTGKVALNEAAALLRADVDALRITDVMDISGSLVPNADRTRLVSNLEGPFLDVSPLIQRRLREGASDDGLPLILAGEFDRLRIAEGYDVSEAEVRMESLPLGVERMALSGTAPGGAPMALSIVPGEDGRELSVTLPDASAAAQSLFGFSGTQDGELLVSASLPAVGEPGAIIGEAEVDDLTLTRAPILAQMLSLASLTGLGDTLSGQGLRFSSIDMEFAFREGRLSLRDSRASGPALGLTVEGEVDLTGRQLDLNGVLVPAYRANSLLGDIPLIGDILVGKKGEGILSLGYTVAGPYDRAQVAVNPLSALTPGVLREIFNPQREDIEDLVAQEAE